MVTIAQFTQFSNRPVTEAEFPYLEARCNVLLSTLCGGRWNDADEVCQKAEMLQIEFVLDLGGLVSWQNGEGAVASRSYAVGGESESVTYIQTSETESGKRVFNGLAISPLAWSLLREAGILKRIERVRTW